MPSSDVFKQYLRWLDIDYKKSKAVKIHYVVVHVHAIIQAFTIHVGKCCNLVPTHSCFELEGNKLLSSKEGLKSHKLSSFAANWTLSAPQNGYTNSRSELSCSVLLSTRMTLFSDVFASTPTGESESTQSTSLSTWNAVVSPSSASAAISTAIWLTIFEVVAAVTRIQHKHWQQVVEIGEKPDTFS